MKKEVPYYFLVADDHSIVRNGLALLIKSCFEECYIYQAGSFDEITEKVSQIQLDLLILDISFPEGSTLNLLSKLKGIQPDLKILMFSSFDEEVYALRYMKAGADGYISKISQPDEIQKALKTILSEGKYTSDKIKNKIIDSYMSRKNDNPLDQLSERELEIATLLVNGYGNLEISNELNLKATTISTYKTRVFEKLGITNIPSLIQIFSLYNDK